MPLREALPPATTKATRCQEVHSVAVHTCPAICADKTFCPAIITGRILPTRLGCTGLYGVLFGTLFFVELHLKTSPS